MTLLVKLFPHPLTYKLPRPLCYNIQSVQFDHFPDPLCLALFCTLCPLCMQNLELNYSNLIYGYRVHVYMLVDISPKNPEMCTISKEGQFVQRQCVLNFVTYIVQTSMSAGLLYLVRPDVLTYACPSSRGPHMIFDLCECVCLCVCVCVYMCHTRHKHCLINESTVHNFTLFIIIRPGMSAPAMCKRTFH